MGTLSEPHLCQILLEQAMAASRTAGSASLFRFRDSNLTSCLQTPRSALIYDIINGLLDGMPGCLGAGRNRV